MGRWLTYDELDALSREELHYLLHMRIIFRVGRYNPTRYRWNIAYQPD